MTLGDSSEQVMAKDVGKGPMACARDFLRDGDMLKRELRVGLQHEQPGTWKSKHFTICRYLSASFLVPVLVLTSLPLSTAFPAVESDANASFQSYTFNSPDLPSTVLVPQVHRLQQSAQV